MFKLRQFTSRLTLIFLLAAVPAFAADSAVKLERIDKPGLHNVYRINAQFFSGSSPEGESGFRSLRELGVRSIISVDGARPEVELARKFGLRYVHVPISYDGISQPQLQVLVKAARELASPIYVHCQHGKHRGPAAIASLRICLDPSCTVAEALAIMRQAGTDPKYAGLYRLPHDLKRPTDSDLAKLPKELPEVAKVPALTELMVSMDATWDRIKLGQLAAATNHEKADSAQAAVLLHEHFREAGRLPDAPPRPPEFRAFLAASQIIARDLEAGLKASPSSTPNTARLIAELQIQCARCHTKFRDAVHK